ncbi:hypothetical protein HYC85_026861 [Camellia sinensis]|uniref:non-specific serine/threonine protein kinase n=1 Tax=Camellia sinensis TaxID=4442 RepID=A0A7J7G4R6_CAMSI|nr:hypothetical protein HYC85_026861 [Camellia sinensis]
MPLCLDPNPPLWVKDITGRDSATASNGTLDVTSDHQQQQPRDPPPINQIVLVLYKYPVIGWPAYICTTFSIRILTDPNSEGAGDGMSFVLAQDAAPSPPNSFGSFLDVVHQLAIEFDTYKNEFDPDDNHIAIDTVSVEKPVAVKSLNSTGINLKSGREITVRVEYDGWTKNHQIYVGYNGDPLVSFLNHTMKLQHTVPSSVSAGFTAGTGEKEYLAEICTISCLRHKNLLQLQGWCHDHDQLLLVYEYMPNGSLDHFVDEDNTFLDWATRYKVLLGLASALVYLHEECGNPVVHRDVKPNNVMLDSEYNAHLGDFGLARLLQNEASVTTRIVGTPGVDTPFLTVLKTWTSSF